MYSSLNDIKKSISESEIVNLTDDNANGYIDETVVNECLSKADELINGYLRGKYLLPIVNVPSLIKNISVELAIYYLYSRRFRTDIPESIEKIYKAQVKILEQIQKGFIVLGIESQSVDGVQTGIYRTNRKISDKVFGKDFLNRF